MDDKAVEIQQRIDEELEHLVWLKRHMPDAKKLIAKSNDRLLSLNEQLQLFDDIHSYLSPSTH